MVGGWAEGVEVAIDGLGDDVVEDFGGNEDSNEEEENEGMGAEDLLHSRMKLDASLIGTAVVTS